MNFIRDSCWLFEAGVVLYDRLDCARRFGLAIDYRWFCFGGVSLTLCFLTGSLLLQCNSVPFAENQFRPLRSLLLIFWLPENLGDLKKF